MRLIDAPRRLAAAGLVAGVLLCARGAAGRDGDFVGLRLEARALMGNPREVLVEGSTAWVALDSGVAVYDVTDASAPALVSHLYLDGTAYALAHAGTTLYVAGGESGLVILDAADPANLAVVAKVPSEDARGVAVAGSIAYVADAGWAPAGQALLIVDVTTPGLPSVLATLPLANGALDVAVQGTHALVGIGYDVAQPRGLVVVDVAIPAAPVQRGFLDTGTPVNDVAVVGTTAYLATGVPLSGALVVADVSVPSAPTRIGRASIGDSARGVAVMGTVAQVAASSLGLLTYDVSIPANPRRIDALATGREAVAVSTRGDVAVVAERNSDGRGSVSTVSTPAPPARLAPLGGVAFAEATALATIVDRAFILRRDGLVVADAPAAPVSILGSWLPPSADLDGLSVSGGLAAVGQADCVRMVDVSNPSSPVEVGQACLDNGAAFDVALDGPILYVATGRTLDVFDLIVPASPALLASFDAGVAALAVAVDGADVVVGGGGSVALLDVSDPSAPSLRGTVALLDDPQSVAIEAGLVAVTGLVDALILVDSGTQAVVGRLGGGPAYDVALNDGHAFLASAEAGVAVVDIADPTTPVAIAAYDTSSRAVGVATDGVLVHAVTKDSQFWTFTCSACSIGCTAVAVVDAPASACELERFTLDGSLSTSSGCSGVLEYQWSRDGVDLAGEVAPTLLVDGGLVAGLHRFGLDVTCSTDPSCTASTTASVRLSPESYAVVDEASLRVDRMGASDDVTWTLSGGAGTINVHRALDPALVTPSAIDDATIVATRPGPPYVEASSPGVGNCYYFVVYGRGACSGHSVVP